MSMPKSASPLSASLNRRVARQQCAHLGRSGRDLVVLGRSLSIGAQRPISAVMRFLDIFAVAAICARARGVCGDRGQSPDRERIGRPGKI